MLAEGFQGGDTVYREPGSAWENAYTESFNGRLGDELLKREEYREHYNRRRPHSALGYRTPLEFAATCRATIVANEGIVGEEREKELEFVPVLS